MASKAAMLAIAENVIKRYQGAIGAAHHRALQYEQIKSTNMKTAIGHLYHGLDFPRKIKYSIEEWEAFNWDVSLPDCLALDGRITYAEMMAGIDAMIAQADVIVDKIKRDELISHDEVSAEVQATCEDIYRKLPLPETLTEEEKQKMILKVDPDNEADVLVSIAEEKFKSVVSKKA